MKTPKNGGPYFPTIGSLLLAHGWSAAWTQSEEFGKESNPAGLCRTLAFRQSPAPPVRNSIFPLGFSLEAPALPELSSREVGVRVMDYPLFPTMDSLIFISLHLQRQTYLDTAGS